VGLTALTIGPAVVQIYDQVYALAVQASPPEEMEGFDALFERISTA
jgi:hypothetical protein